MLIVFNLILFVALAGLIYRFNGGREQKLLWLITFSLHLIAGITFALIYIFYYDGKGDTFFLFNKSGLVSELIKKDSVAGFQDLFSKSRLSPTFNNMLVNDSSFYTIKLLSPLHLLTGGNYLLTTIYCSIFSFFSSWQVVCALGVFSKALRISLVVVFLFIPSVLFWSSGILPQTFIHCSICLFTAGLAYLAHPKIKWFSGLILCVVGAIALSLLSWPRFLPFVSLALPLLITHHVSKRFQLFRLYFWLRWLLFSFLSSFSFFLLIRTFPEEPVLLDNTNFAHISGSATMLNPSAYIFGGDQTQPLTLIKSTWAGMHLSIFHWKSPALILSSMENICFFLLLPFALFWLYVRFIKRRAGLKGYLFFTAVLLFVIYLSFVSGWSISNYGVLIRNRASYQPFLFLLMIFPAVHLFTDFRYLNEKQINSKKHST